MSHSNSLTEAGGNVEGTFKFFFAVATGSYTFENNKSLSEKEMWKVHFHGSASQTTLEKCEMNYSNLSLLERLV